MKTYNNSKIIFERLKKNDVKHPSAKDIKETKILFKDFKINIDIPDFEIKRALYNWRERIIKGFI